MLPVRRLLWAAIGVAAAIGAILVAIPRLDLELSSLVYDTEGGFLLDRSGLVLLVSRAVTVACWIAIAGALLLIVANRAAGRPVLRGLGTSRLLLILLTFVLGPGLLVNSVLKQHVGRARPVEIVEFGGPAQFTRAATPASQCRRNCAFPSGDAAAAFALAAVGVATGSTALLGGALVIGVFVSAVRVLTGAHFVSDVAFSALLTLLMIVVLDRLLVRPACVAPR